jgi:hypothetical protein
MEWARFLAIAKENVCMDEKGARNGIQEIRLDVNGNEISEREQHENDSHRF